MPNLACPNLNATSSVQAWIDKSRKMTVHTSHVVEQTALKLASHCSILHGHHHLSNFEKKTVEFL